MGDTSNVAEVRPQSKNELMAELKKALDKGDFKAVATVSRKIDQLTRAAEKAEQAAVEAKLKLVVDKVKAAITRAVQPIIDSKALDAADGIWFSYDFGDKAPTVRLTKTAARRTSSGGGGGKKFDISTNDMLAKHGDEEYKDGATFKQAYADSTDKNHRFAIRQKLLKLEGVI